MYLSFFRLDMTPLYLTFKKVGTGTLFSRLLSSMTLLLFFLFFFLGHNTYIWDLVEVNMVIKVEVALVDKGSETIKRDVIFHWGKKKKKS